MASDLAVLRMTFHQIFDTKIKPAFVGDKLLSGVYEPIRKTEESALPNVSEQLGMQEKSTEKGVKVNC